MEQDKVDFRLSSISIIDKQINTELIKTFENREVNSNKFISRVNISYKVDRDNSSILIKTGVVTTTTNSDVIYQIVIENKFSINNIQKLIQIDSKGEVLIKNESFLFFIVDHSLSHLRAYQHLYLNEYLNKINYIPIGYVKKFMAPENARK